MHEMASLTTVSIKVGSPLRQIGLIARMLRTLIKYRELTRIKGLHHSGLINLYVSIIISNIIFTWPSKALHIHVEYVCEGTKEESRNLSTATEGDTSVKYHLKWGSANYRCLQSKILPTPPSPQKNKKQSGHCGDVAVSGVWTVFMSSEVYKSAMNIAI